MNISQINLRIVVLITLSGVFRLVRSGAVNLFGPKCEDGLDGSKVKCSILINPYKENEKWIQFKLGDLCDDNKALKLRIIRDDTNIDVSNLRVNASVSKITECDEPTNIYDLTSTRPSQARISIGMSGDATVNTDLTSDVSNLEFPVEVTTGQLCGPIRVVFRVLDNNGVMILGQKTTSVQVNVDCQFVSNSSRFVGNGDVKLDVTYGSSEIPVVEVGDRNPFGATSQVKVDFGNCYWPKTAACLYCGFDEETGGVGLDDEMWNAISTIEGRQNWAKNWKGENAKNFFEKLHRLGLCETMHMSPLLEKPSVVPVTTNEGTYPEGTLNLQQTYIPLPFAYDAMKNAYIYRNETRCGMMVMVDYLNQCPDSDRSNNFAVFPAKLVVNESKVEAVRNSIQPTWPDAETGVPPEQVNKACTVLTNYLDKGKTGMMFPAPNNPMYKDNIGVVYKRGMFSPLSFYDSRWWTSTAMLKMSALNEDQCPAQCDEKYKQTQNVDGLHKRMIEMMSAAMNETDNLIQAMSNSEFNDELTKYKDISSLARKLSNVLTKIPWAKREISKMLVKMMKMGDDDDDEDKDEDGYPRPGPRPSPPRPGTRPSPDHIKYSLPDKMRRNGPFYIPKYSGMGMDCWDNGCDLEDSKSACSENEWGQSGSYNGNFGQLARINSRFESSQVGKLLEAFGTFKPMKDQKTYYWFYNALKENKVNTLDSTYTWDDGAATNFTNWGGEEPNDYNGDPELCTFVIPETPGNKGPLSMYGPMWGDINCGADSFDFPGTESRVVMVPICEVRESKCSNTYNGGEGFCHNGGSCWIASNGTSQCSCMNDWSYGPRCEYTRDTYETSSEPNWNRYGNSTNPTYGDKTTAYPPVCCRAINAYCEACNAGKPVKQWCKDNPDTSIPGCNKDFGGKKGKREANEEDDEGMYSDESGEDYGSDVKDDYLQRKKRSIDDQDINSKHNEEDYNYGAHDDSLKRKKRENRYKGMNDENDNVNFEGFRKDKYKKMYNGKNNANDKYDWIDGQDRHDDRRADSEMGWKNRRRDMGGKGGKDWMEMEGRWNNRMGGMKRYPGKWGKDDDMSMDMEDQWENFVEDIAKCDNHKRCGKNGLLQKLSSCICQSLWSKNSDPSGELCQAIPKDTRMQMVRVISMFIKENGPIMPKNYTVMRDLGRLGKMFEKKFKTFFMLPVETNDMKVLVEMVRDNLTEALTRWQDAGVKKEDLAALTLYRDFYIEFVNSGSMLDTSTNFVQMKQGLDRTNAQRCDRRGKVGDAPSKAEFCIAYRAQKLADQYKCPLIKFTEEFLKTNDLDMGAKEIIKENMKHLQTMSGGKGSCGKNKGGMMGNDVPTIWRKNMGNIVKGAFCEMDGEWYWQKVATCGCNQCAGMNDDYEDKDDWMKDMMDDFDEDYYEDQ